jgi:hypothetical protein
MAIAEARRTGVGGLKVRAVGYWSYNYGEVREETVRQVTEDQILTVEGSSYLRRTGLPFTLYSDGYRLTREELARFEAALARGEQRGT